MNTATAALNFHRRLQEQASKFYEALAVKFKEKSEIFQAFAREHRRHQRDVQRAYNYIISDAMEACFAFEGMNEADYEIETKIHNTLPYNEALKMAIILEEVNYKFSVDGANRCRGMLHDVPEALDEVANRSMKRKQNLQVLLDSE